MQEPDRPTFVAGNVEDRMKRVQLTAHGLFLYLQEIRDGINRDGVLKDDDRSNNFPKLLR